MLTTKLFIPPPRPTLVPRPHLVQRLDDALGVGRGLVLISAPAGFGKTTLLGEWIAQRAPPVAWLSLDDGDNDPARFLTYLIAALESLGRGNSAFAEVLTLLQAPQPPPLDSLLTLIVNQLTVPASPIVLILDDYHVIHAQPIHDILNFLIEHKPPSMRVTVQVV